LKRRVGLIAYDFPPLNSGGAQRPFQMVKSLVNEGFDLTVFTLNEECYNSSNLSFSLAEEDLVGFNIVRSGLRKLSWIDKIHESYYFNLVDPIGDRWFINLLRAIESQNKVQKFDYLIFTCPPFSLAKIALKVNKRLAIPYILDFRDAWSQWNIAPYASKLHYNMLLRLERKCINNAYLIAYTSVQQFQDLLKAHKLLPTKKFIYVPNGFKQYLDLPEYNSDDIVITYVGSFYFNPYTNNLSKKKWFQKKWYQLLQYNPRIEDWKYRSPYYFFKIVHEMLMIYPSLKNKLKLVFIGKKEFWFDEMVDEFGLKGIIEHNGFIEKKNVEHFLTKSDYLLLTSSKITNGRNYSVAGKTFEYISMKKPILGVVTEGEQKDLLEKSGIALLIDPDQSVQSGILLGEVLSTNKGKYILNKEYCDSFHYPNNFKMLIQNLVCSKTV